MSGFQLKVKYNEQTPSLASRTALKKVEICISKCLALINDLFASGAEATFVHLFHFVFIVIPMSLWEEEEELETTCLSGKEQNVHSMNLVDCNLLDNSCTFYF